jgi:hypothetical protein
MHRRLVICIALALCLAIPGEAAAQGGPPAVSVIHSETIRVGLYPVTVGFSEWPVHAERSLDIIFVSAAGSPARRARSRSLGPLAARRPCDSFAIRACALLGGWTSSPCLNRADGRCDCSSTDRRAAAPGSCQSPCWSGPAHRPSSAGSPPCSSPVASSRCSASPGGGDSPSGSGRHGHGRSGYPACRGGLRPPDPRSGRMLPDSGCFGWSQIRRLAAHRPSDSGECCLRRSGQEASPARSPASCLVTAGGLPAGLPNSAATISLTPDASPRGRAQRWSLLDRS